MKIYSQENKEKISEQKKEYYVQNKEIIQERNKERNKEIIKCSCGCKITRGWLKSHEKTKKHLDFLSQ